MPRRLLLTHTFASDQATLDAYNQRHLGQREVPVAAIAGTVGRGWLRDARRAGRWTRTPRYQVIRAALEMGAVLPPVELYLLAGNYYILDGHHRVAAARELGALEIDATVTEFLPHAEPAATWHRERAAFERDTGLTGMHVRRPGGYAELRHQLAAHCGKLPARTRAAPPFRLIAADWARTVYRPAIAELIRRGVPDREPHLTAAEIFLDFHDFAAGRGAAPLCGDQFAAVAAAYARHRRAPWLARLVGREAGGRRAPDGGRCDCCAVS